MSEQALTVDEELERLRRRFEEAGMVRRAGFGERPVLLVIDMIRGFTDPASPLGSDAPDTVAAIGPLLVAARDPRKPPALPRPGLAARLGRSGPGGGERPAPGRGACRRHPGRLPPLPLARHA